MGTAYTLCCNTNVESLTGVAIEALKTFSDEKCELILLLRCCYYIHALVKLANVKQPSHTHVPVFRRGRTAQFFRIVCGNSSRSFRGLYRRPEKNRKSIILACRDMSVHAYRNVSGDNLNFKTNVTQSPHCTDDDVKRLISAKDWR